MDPENKPYIGITGFTTVDQVDEIKRYWNSIRCETHDLMMGFLVSYKQLARISNKNPRYIELTELKRCLDLINSGMINLMHNHSPFLPRIFRVIHYNTHTKAFAKEIEDLGQQLRWSFDGVQLNLIDPDPSEIQYLQDKYHLKIILQLNSAILNDLKKLAKYESLHCAYYLIDGSGGKGKTADLEQMQNTINEVSRAMPNCTLLGIAGGITPDTIVSYPHQIHLLDTFDCESGVRTMDILDPMKAKLYLANFVLTNNEQLQPLMDKKMNCFDNCIYKEECKFLKSGLAEEEKNDPKYMNDLFASCSFNNFDMKPPKQDDD